MNVPELQDSSLKFLLMFLASMEAGLESAENDKEKANEEIDMNCN